MLLPVPPAVQAVIQRCSLSNEEMRNVQLASQLAQRVQNPTPASEADSEQSDARERMRRKVRTIARMARMFKTLRQENEAILRLKGVCPGHRLETGLLLAGKDKIHSELEKFGHAISVDAANEIRPQEECTTPVTAVRSVIKAGEQEDSDEELSASSP